MSVTYSLLLKRMVAVVVRMQIPLQYTHCSFMHPSCSSTYSHSLHLIACVCTYTVFESIAENYKLQHLLLLCLLDVAVAGVTAVEGVTVRRETDLPAAARSRITSRAGSTTTVNKGQAFVLGKRAFLHRQVSILVHPATTHIVHSVQCIQSVQCAMYTLCTVCVVAVHARSSSVHLSMRQDASAIMHAPT
jgi:hypothetical protein